MNHNLETLTLPMRAASKGSDWIRRERASALYRNTAVTLAGTLICAFALVLLLWPVAPLGHLMLWLGSISSLTLGRLVLQQRFRSGDDGLHDERPADHWQSWYLGGVLLSGLAWGAVSIFLFPQHSPVHQVYIAFLLAGITGGASTVYSPVRGAFLLFAIPALTPFVIRLWVEGNQDSQILAAMVAAFALIMSRVAAQAGGALTAMLELQTKNAQLTEALHHQATHDSLVNLVNHGEFQRRLHRLVNRSSGPNEDFALIFIDLDMFKDVNDSGGHAAGDAVLRAVGSILTAHTRSRDTAARVGGDEFALLLERCPPEKALEIAEHVRAEIAALRLEFDQHVFSIAASIGVTYGQTGLHTATSVLKSADAACYAAKESGRNRVRMLPADDMFKTTGRFNIAVLERAEA